MPSMISLKKMANWVWKGVYPKVFGCSFYEKSRQRRKRGGRREKYNGENSDSLSLLPVNWRMAADCNTAHSCYLDMLIMVPGFNLFHYLISYISSIEAWYSWCCQFQTKLNIMWGWVGWFNHPQPHKPPHHPTHPPTHLGKLISQFQYILLSI